MRLGNVLVGLASLLSLGGGAESTSRSLRGSAVDPAKLELDQPAFDPIPPDLYLSLSRELAENSTVTSTRDVSLQVAKSGESYAATFPVRNYFESDDLYLRPTVASDDGQLPDWLSVTPDAPLQSVSTHSTNGAFERIKFDGDIAYVAMGDGGVFTYNMSDPTAPKMLSHFATAGEAKDVAINGDTVYIADGSKGLIIANRTADFALTEVGDVSPFGGVTAVAHVDNTTYLAGAAGVMAYDLADLTQPQLLSELAIAGSPQSLALSGDYLLAASGLGGLHVLNRTATDLSLLHTLPVPMGNLTLAQDMYVHDGKIYLPNPDGDGVKISLTDALTGTSTIIEGLPRVLPLYNVGYITAGTPKSLTFSQN